MSINETAAALAADLIAKRKMLGVEKRFILGIAGFPAAGKTTAAAAIVEQLNNLDASHPAIVVPMDGFHRYNAELRELGLFELKGVPDSFDGEAFIDLLRRLRKDENQKIGCPAFDRAIEEPTPDAIIVGPEHKIIVVEGNYLLLDAPPWNQVRMYMDEVWFIDSTLATIEPRLLERHIKGGRSPEAARAKMEGTDLPNALIIGASRQNADRLVSF